MLFPAKLANSFKPFAKAQGKVKRVDGMTQQVRKMLQEADQKIILMVRG